MEAVAQLGARRPSLVDELEVTFYGEVESSCRAIAETYLRKPVVATNRAVRRVRPPPRGAAGGRRCRRCPGASSGPARAWASSSRGSCSTTSGRTGRSSRCCRRVTPGGSWASSTGAWSPIPSRRPSPERSSGSSRLPRGAGRSRTEVRPVALAGRLAECPGRGSRRSAERTMAVGLVIGPVGRIGDAFRVGPRCRGASRSAPSPGCRRGGRLDPARRASPRARPRRPRDRDGRELPVAAGDPPAVRGVHPDRGGAAHRRVGTVSRIAAILFAVTYGIPRLGHLTLRAMPRSRVALRRRGRRSASAGRSAQRGDRGDADAAPAVHRRGAHRRFVVQRPGIVRPSCGRTACRRRLPP